MNTAFRIWASLVSLAIVVQVGLAAYGAFNAIDKSDDNGTIGKDAVSSGFDAHAALGYAIVAGAIVLIVLAVATRRAAPGRLRWTGLIFGLLVVQIVLALALPLTLPAFNLLGALVVAAAALGAYVAFVRFFGRRAV